MSSDRPIYRYGASFIDRTSGLRFEAHHPSARPDRWSAYLDGAVREYERYGLENLVDRRALERADGVSLFFVGVDAEDKVVAGLRCHGPLEGPEASLALAEMALSPEAADHREMVGGATPYGVVEIKGAWREWSGDGNHLVSATLSRCCAHALEWLGSEIALAAVADRMKELLALSGGRMMGEKAAPYPSEQYRTILVTWRRARYGDDVPPDQAVLLRDEARQLQQPPPAGAMTGWKPVLLDVRRRADRQILENLRSDPGIELVDLVERQRQELASLLAEVDSSLLEEAPRQVYYPWRRSVVRVLGPRAYPVVRLDRNRNRITRDEQQRLRSQRVGIVGLSSGHLVAVTVALEGLCGELRLADFDDIELTNLNRLPATVGECGINKAVVAARRVSEIDPYLPVRIATDGIHAGNAEEFVAGLDVLIEECDEIAIKALVREVARRHRVAVVMETSDRGLLDVERFDLEPDRPIFHGLLPGVTASTMTSLTTLEKVPHVLRLVDPQQVSARGAASLAEIGRTLSTWPQLGADVTLGGASVAVAVRRLGLGEPVPSGRVRIDLESLVGSLEDPPAPRDEEPVPIWPGSSTPADPLDAVAHVASLAPSGGNAQPWWLELSGNILSFELERSRTSTMDVRSRGSYVAIGAAVFNARVAAAAAGTLGPVKLFPEGAASDTIATLAIDEGEDEELAALYSATIDRCSNRRLGVPEPIDLSLAALLADGVAREGGTLHLVTDRDRLRECADILGAAERIRFLTPTLHHEMMEELRWPGEDARTGIDVRTLELSGADLATLGVVRRADVMALLETWDAGQALGENARRAVEASSALAIVTVSDSSPTSYVKGGGAVERLWISAQRAGLGVQPVSPVFLFAVQQADFEALGGSRWANDLRILTERFRSVVDVPPTSSLVLVLRLSHVRPPSARSLRLPLDSVRRRRGGVARAGSGS